jgi:transcription elongation factor GreA
LWFIIYWRKIMSSKKKSDQPLKNFSLSEAATEYLISLTPDTRAKAQPEVTKFIRWHGETRLVQDLSPQQVESYAEQLTTTISDVADKIEPVKDFLSFTYKQGFTKSKLAPHIKIKKLQTRISRSYRMNEQKNIVLTAEGFAQLETELQALIHERPKIIEEIHRAAADKDFRENAPLAAAREQMGKIEGRIKELEATLKSASLLNKKKDTSHIALIGDSVVLKDLSTSETFDYLLVDIKEANPSAGKLSVKSPLGKATVGHKIGDTIEVNAPAGILPYQIIDIKQK